MALDQISGGAAVDGLYLEVEHASLRFLFPEFGLRSVTSTYLAKPLAGADYAACIVIPELVPGIDDRPETATPGVPGRRCPRISGERTGYAYSAI